MTAWEDGDGVTVQSGLLCCRIQKGELLLSSLNRKGFAPVSGKLVALLENKELHEDYELSTIHRFEGVTEKITLEESGPVRVVVKVEGVHKAVHPSDKERTVFPFSLRLYFYADSDEIKIVHSFTFDIDEKQDFLKGLALELHMEASGELYNRHVGFVCESGMFYEAVQPAYYGLGWTYPGEPVPENVSLYQRQQVFDSGVGDSTAVGRNKLVRHTTYAVRDLGDVAADDFDLVRFVGGADKAHHLAGLSIHRGSDRGASDFNRLVEVGL